MLGLGLALDLVRSARAIVLGPEVNGDPGFDTPAYWGADAGCSVSGSKANFTATSGNVFKGGLVTPGQAYRVTFTVDSISGGNIKADLGGSTGTFRTTAGTYTEDIVAGAGGYIALGWGSGAALTGVADNFSVKAIS